MPFLGRNVMSLVAILLIILVILLGGFSGLGGGALMGPDIAVAKGLVS
jgi:hypothetical protein